MTLLTLVAGAERYGIDVREIQRVIPLPRLRPLAMTPPWVAGVFSLSGELVPVIDLCRLHGGQPARPRFGTRVVITRHPLADGSTRPLGVLAERANVDELADIVRLAIDLGVDRVKGHHLWAHFEQIEGQSMRRSPEAIRRWNAAVLAAREAAAERPLDNGRHILLENVFLLDAQATEDLAPGGPCPFLGQEAWVSALGRFDPCCAPDAQRRTLADFASLHEHGLMDIWNGEAYRRLVATYRNRTLCRAAICASPWR